MTKEEIKQGVIEVLIRKNLMGQTQIIELIELLGEDKFYDFVFKMSGQTLRIPNADRIWREFRNELVGQVLDEADNRFVRKELKERWNLTSANLSMIYKQYREDVENRDYDPEIKSHEHMIEKIKKRRQKGEISAQRAHSDIKTFNQFIVQRKKDLEFALKLAAINYPESLDSDKNDEIAKALRRVRKQIKNSEEAKVRRKVRNQKGFFKEK
jgi:hypothetical protein